jgi:Holliday junction DNA helicase RuvB
LKYLIEKAQAEEKSLDHILLCGARELTRKVYPYIYKLQGIQARIASASSITQPGDLAAIFVHLQARNILFIDEIDRLGKSLTTVLCSAMEDYALDIVIGKGLAAKNARLPLHRFTVIGVTAHPELLPGDLMELFMMRLWIDDQSFHGDKGTIID